MVIYGFQYSFVYHQINLPVRFNIMYLCFILLVEAKMSNKIKSSSLSIDPLYTTPQQVC